MLPLVFKENGKKAQKSNTMRKNDLGLCMALGCPQFFLLITTTKLVFECWHFYLKISKSENLGLHHI